MTWNQHYWGLDPDLIVFAGNGQGELWAEDDAEFIASTNALFDPQIDLGTTDVYKQPQTIEQVRAHFRRRPEIPQE